MAKANRLALIRQGLSWAGIALLVAAGWLAAEWRANNTDDWLRDRLLQQAVEIAQAIDPEAIRGLAFSSDDQNNPLFMRLREQLIAYGQVIPQRGIYSLALRNSQIVFGPESYAEGDPMSSPPGTAYEQPWPEDFAIFETGRPYTVGPEVDEYGSFVSALAPVLDPNSGDVMMVVGIDILADDWRSQVAAARHAPLLATLGLSLVVLCFRGALWWRDRQSPALRSRLRHLETAMVGIPGLCIIIAASLLIQETDRRERQLIFEKLAEARAASIRAAFRDIHHDLLAIDRFYRGSQYVDRQEFAAFTAPMARVATVRAYGWAPSVLAIQKESFENEARRAGADGFVIWELDANGARVPAAGRDVFYPIYYVEPVAGNERMLGFDLGSEISRQTAIEGALETGLVMASDPIHLLDDPADRWGMLAVKATATIGAAQATQSSGIALGAVRMQSALESALWRYADETPLIAVSLVDLSTTPTVLATFPSEYEGAHLSANGWSASHGHPLSQVHPLFAFGRTLAIVSHTTPAFDALHSMRIGWLVIIAGLCLAVIGTAFVALLRNRQEALTQQVERRLTELHQSEEQLHQSQAKLLSIFSAAPAGIGMVVNRVIREVNDSFCQMTGYTRAELIGQDARLVYASEEDYALVGDEKYRQIRKTGFGTVETRWRHKDGHVMDILLSSAALDPANLSAGVTFTALDITERKRSEEALRAERDRAQRYLDVAGVILLHLDPDGRVTLINQKGLEVLGISEMEAVGKVWVDHFVPPQDREMTRLSLLALMNGAAPEAEYRENAVLSPSGEVRLVAWHNTMLRDQEGQCLGLLCSGEDVTEQRRAQKALRASEERYQRISEMISDYAYAFHVESDGSLRLEWVVGGFERITGYSPEESEDRGGWAQLTHPDDIAIAQGRAQRLFGGEQDTSEFRIVRKDGSVRWIRDHGYPLWDKAEGRIVRIYGAAEDITDRRHAQEERLEMERRLLQAQKLESLGVLAGGIAHDFNNLLMAILGNLDLAMEDISPLSAARETIREASIAARRAADLTRQLLAYAGKGRFVTRQVDLSAVVQENAHLLRAAIARNITFSLQLASDLPAIEADPSQIQQVIMNLITNASEAIGDQPGVIVITTGAHDYDTSDLKDNRLSEALPGRYAYLEVCDTGCGMDEAIQQRMFEPFFTTKFTGRGLGMSAVEGVVRGHHGAIFVQSAVGQGSTIRVLFPASHAAWDATDGLSLSAKAEVVQNPLLQGTALVVDDEAAVRHVCGAMLKRFGLEILEAADGQEAVTLFRERAHQIDIVVLDLSMPLMDGLTALQELRRIQPDVKIVLSSGYNEQEATQRLTGAGVAGFIQKPYQLQSLRAEVARVLGQAR